MATSLDSTLRSHIYHEHRAAGEYIFDEALVSRAVERLQGDVSLRSNSIMLDTSQEPGPGLQNDPRQVSSKKHNRAVVRIQRAHVIYLGNLPVREKANEPKGRDLHDVQIPIYTEARG